MEKWVKFFDTVFAEYDIAYLDDDLLVKLGFTGLKSISAKRFLSSGKYKGMFSITKDEDNDRLVVALSSKINFGYSMKMATKEYLYSLASDEDIPERQVKIKGKIKADAIVPVAPITNDKYFWYPPDVDFIIRNAIEKCKNSYVYGATGCGKTTLIKNLCEQLGKPYRNINLNGESSVDDFIGYWTLENSKTVYVEGVLPTAMREGRVLIIDEFDAATPEVLFSLQPVLEGGILNLLKVNQQVVPQEGFCIIATANTFGKGDMTTLYQGVHSQNEATYDRWEYIVKMDYPNQDEESIILQKRTGVSKPMADLIADFILKCRGLTNVYTTFSTRKALMLAQSYLEFKDIWVALRVSIFDRVSDEDRAAIYEIAQRIFGG